MPFVRGGGPLPPEGTYTCSVDAAGAETDLKKSPNSLVSVTLTDVDGAFTQTVFYVPDEVKREILAVALAAISTKSQANAGLHDPATKAFPKCYKLEIVAG